MLELTNIQIEVLDRPNCNGRVYRTCLIERELDRLTDVIAESRMYGSGYDDYVANNYTTRLASVTHIVTRLKIEDGVLRGDIRILDTDRGKILADLLGREESRIRFALMGVGSCQLEMIEPELAATVIQDDYRLQTINWWLDDSTDPTPVRALPGRLYQEDE